MFGFSAKRRSERGAAEHVHARRSSVRRLSVEAMEGRLMLSTNAADFLSPNYDAIQFSLDATGVQPASIETVYFHSFKDGGSLTFFTPTLDGAVAGVPIFLRDNNLSAGVISGSANVTRGNFNVGAPAVFDSDTLPTPGIPVLVISPNSSDATTYANSPSPLAADLIEELGDDEGGEIPIQSIIASIGPGAISTIGDRAIVSAPVGPQEIAAAKIPTSAFDDFRISGEWARPMMLELAGGEHRTPEREGTDRAGEFGDLRDGERATSESPLSNNYNSEHSGVKLARYVSDDNNLRQGAIRTMASKAPNDLQVANAEREVATVEAVAQWVLSSRLDSDSPPSREAPAGTASDGPLNFDNMHSARAEVFDSLGAEELAGAPLIDHVNTWATPLKATSLLMILALERIATGNSRRGKAHPMAQAQLP
jgi:hypothetical protein